VHVGKLVFVSWL